MQLYSLLPLKELSGYAYDIDDDPDPCMYGIKINDMKNDVYNMFKVEILLNFDWLKNSD